MIATQHPTKRPQGRAPASSTLRPRVPFLVRPIGAIGGSMERVEDDQALRERHPGEE